MSSEQSLIDSNSTNRLQHKLYQINSSLPADPWLPYNAFTTALTLEKQVNDPIWSGDIRVARISHTTNGAEELSVFDLTTDNLYVQGEPSRPPINHDRNIQLGFEVVKVLKFEGQYKKNDENNNPFYWRGEYYTTNSPRSTPADFLITSVAYTGPPAVENIFLTFNYAGPIQRCCYQ